MKREELTDKEYDEMLDFCKSGKADKYVLTEQDLQELKKASYEDRHCEHAMASSMYLDSDCPKCGPCGSIVVFTNNIHKYKTVCSNCYGYIKFGFPHKYERHINA